MQRCGKVNNTMIWWPRKTNKTNCFKVKTWRGFNLAILKIKQIHYKRIEVFTIRFNPKSIATSCSNLLTRPYANSESTNSFSSWIYRQHKPPCLWLWDSTQRFQITFSNDLDAATMFYQTLYCSFCSGRFLCS